MTAQTNRQVLPPKLQGETIQLTPFDFSSKMASGETISTQSVTATVYSGVDSSPSSIISGAATASGQTVLQKVTAGVTGTTYLLLCTITTSLSQTLQMAAYLTVQSSVP